MPQNDDLRSRLEREFFQIENHPDLAPDEKVARVIQVCAVTSAVIAVQPVPMADFVLQLPILAYMGFKIGRIRGVDVRQHDAERLVGEILATVGMGFAARQVLAGLTKVALPFLGVVVAIPLFFALIYAVGKVMDFYFRAQAAGHNVTRESMKEVFDRAHAEGVELGKKVAEEQSEKADEPPKAKVKRTPAKKNGRY